jgi:hypothetical protein
MKNLPTLMAFGLLMAGLTITAPQAAQAKGCAGGVAATWDVATGKLTCPGGGGGDDENQNPGKGSKKTKGVKPACVWVPKPDYISGVGQPVEGQGGHYYQKFCAFGQYKTYADFEAATKGWEVPNLQQMQMMRRAGLDVRFFTTPPPVPRPTPEQVMASVVDNLPFPETFLAVNPVATKQVIGVPTWVWLTDEDGKYDPERYEQKTKTIEIEGYQLQWRIVPQMTLTPGDNGQEQTCTGAGIPWSASAEGNPAACTVTYDKAGKYTVTANVGWTVQWWLGGEPQEDIPGPTNTGAQPVTVLEVQTVTR